MSKVISIHKAKAHLSRIVDEVAAGAEIIITKDGKPVARLSPIAVAPRPKKLGLLKGKMKIPGNFNAPLNKDILADFEGR